MLNEAIFERKVYGLKWVCEGLNHRKLSHVTTIYAAPLVIDNGRRSPTSDLRLILRIIIEHKYRVYSALTTIHRWTHVRFGEEKNIFPYHCNIEMLEMFYELPVLSIYCLTLLSDTTIAYEHENIRNSLTYEATQEVKRTISILNLFYPISLEEVPPIL